MPNCLVDVLWEKHQAKSVIIICYILRELPAYVGFVPEAVEAQSRRKDAALYRPISELIWSIHSWHSDSVQMLFLNFIDELLNLNKLMGLSVIRHTTFESKHSFNDHTLDKQERSKNLACKCYENLMCRVLSYSRWQLKMKCKKIHYNWFIPFGLSSLLKIGTFLMECVIKWFVGCILAYNYNADFSCLDFFVLWQHHLEQNFIWKEIEKLIF